MIWMAFLLGVILAIVLPMSLSAGAGNSAARAVLSARTRSADAIGQKLENGKPVTKKEEAFFRGHAARYPQGAIVARYRQAAEARGIKLDIASKTRRFGQEVSP